MLINLKQLKLISVIVALCCFCGNMRAEEDTPKSIANRLQQNGKLTGNVVDELGPVVGASVSVKGTTNGTITDMDGNFTLTNVSMGALIQVSFIGYVTQEVVYTGQTALQIVLKEDALTINEVVVTALGIKKEAKQLGYAVATIDAGELVKTGTPNFATSLYGKASGIRIQAAPGGATSAVSINVRGISSITGNNQPLVIIDGVPVRNGNANEKGYWDDQRINSNGLVDINPEDIATLSILKGASASALYGSEAANGVIMITSKSGKRNTGLGVDFNLSLTEDYIAYMPEMQTVFGPGRYTMGRNDDYQKTSGGFYERTYKGQAYKSIYATTTQFGPKYDGSDVLYWDGKVRKYNALSSNPWKNIFRNGFNQTYNLAVTQGGENSNTRFSYTLVDNTPTQYNSTYAKHNFNLSGSIELNDKLQLDYTANYMRQAVKNRPYRISRLTNNFGGMFGSFEDVALMREMTRTSLGYKNVYGSAQTLTPEESFFFQPAASALLDEYNWNILGREQHEDNNRLIASVTPTYRNIIPGLTLRGRVSTDLTAEKIEKMESTEKPLAFGESTGYYGLTNKRYEIYYGDIMLMYDRDLTDKFGLVAYIGYQGRMEKLFGSTASTSGGLSVENWFHVSASKNKAEAGMQKTEFLKTAYLGSLSLSYDRFIYLEGTARQEQTSTLAPGNNTFFYPSVNASYIFSESLKDKCPSWLDYGKLRLSYGIVGNAPEIYKANMAYKQETASGFIYNQVDKSLGNEGIRPEKKYEWEFGLEGKFFRNRLGFELSYYTNTVKDQILSTTMPQSSGGTSILLNVGELANQGLELSLYGTPVQTADFSWELRGNIGFNKNKVVKLMDGVDELLHSNIDNGAVHIKSLVGQPMGDIFAYVPTVDAKGNKVVDEEGLYLTDYSERKKIGNAMPDATGGLGSTFSYKNWFLDALFDFRIGGNIVNIPYQYMMGRGNLVESLPYRDAAHGGLTYYFEGDDFGGKRIAASSGTGPKGERVYDNGMILPGVKQDGSANDIIVPADYYYVSTYNWGTGDPNVEYGHSIFDNSYLKFRELSLGYSLPAKIAQKFACKRLTLSVYGRNLCFLYKNLPAFDAEATDGTSWISQTQIGGSTATTRSFGISLRASF
ncbi:MAG: SusC/RagA family TonB-linked outer membrane protein [Tannerellaceae bacterium]|nr:SusC/RagA family TonB-linked outer membrane protein [Tannerellaceae bacterium]